MKLITELTEEVQYIKEESEGKQNLFIKGVFAQADVSNRNKRVYPFPILEKEINRYTKECISENKAVGELNHPSGPNINLDRVCILIKEIKQNNKDFEGKALVMSTPMGQIVKNLINDGVKLGVSTRALGSLKPLKEGLNEVQEDLRLLAIDVVADPSAPDAFVQGIMENREWIFNAVTGSWQEQIVETTKKIIQESAIEDLEIKKFKLFENFINSIKI